MKQQISAHAQSLKNKHFLTSILNDIETASQDVPEFYYIPINPVKIRKKTVKTIDFSNQALFDYLESKRKVEEKKLELEIKKQALFDQLKDAN